MHIVQEEEVAKERAKLEEQLAQKGRGGQPAAEATAEAAEGDNPALVSVLRDACSFCIQNCCVLDLLGNGWQICEAANVRVSLVHDTMIISPESEIASVLNDVIRHGIQLNSLHHVTAIHAHSTCC